MGYLDKVKNIGYNESSGRSREYYALDRHPQMSPTNKERHKDALYL
jgi:hypothetical protein